MALGPGRLSGLPPPRRLEGRRMGGRWRAGGHHGPIGHREGSGGGGLGGARGGSGGWIYMPGRDAETQRRINTWFTPDIDACTRLLNDTSTPYLGPLHFSIHVNALPDPPAALVGASRCWPVMPARHGPHYSAQTCIRHTQRQVNPQPSIRPLSISTLNIHSHHPFEYT